MRSSILSLFILSGCTIAPHGSKCTLDVWTYWNGQLVRHERITDRSAGGGAELLSTLALANVDIKHDFSNSLFETHGQFRLGSNTITGDAASIDALGHAIGTAAGSAAGEAARKAIGLP